MFVFDQLDLFIQKNRNGEPFFQLAQVSLEEKYFTHL